MTARSRNGRRYGAHTSIAGSLASSAVEAIELGCNAFQIFTKSPKMWSCPPLDPHEIAELSRLRLEHDLQPLVVHGSYLLNLASLEPVNRHRSIDGFREEIERASAVGAEYLVIHPGSAKGYDDREAAIKNLASALAQAASGFDWSRLELLLENTAGGGSSLGMSFEELASIRTAILDAADAPVGYCLDTAHMFAAGYDISTPAGWRRTLAQAGSALNLEKVKIIHFNDSKTKLGSRLDRHARIGEGHIGSEAMRRIFRSAKLRDKAFLLETPHDDDGTHAAGVRALASWI